MLSLGSFKSLLPLLKKTPILRYYSVHKMNVLVYSGAGTTPESVKHCLETLRRFLSPYYAVVAVGPDVIKNEPWQSKTALLVIPGGADLPICKEFNGEGNKTIRNYVTKGGKYLGFCSGAYYGSAKCEFEVGDLEMEVSGPRELKFFPGVARGAAYKKFVYNSEAGSKAVELETSNELDLSGRIFNYYNGGPVFIDAQKYPGVEVLARYKVPVDVPSDEVRAAIVYAKVGKGDCLLTGTHPEFTPDLFKTNVEDENYTRVTETLREFDAGRIQLLKCCLKKIGLKVNDDPITRPRITPIYLTSLRQGVIPKLIGDLVQNVGIGSDRLLVGTNDTFRIHDSTEGITSMSQMEKQDVYEDPDTAVKEVYVMKDSEVPDRKVTPYFNINLYFQTLSQLSNGNIPDYGSTVGYGEVVTSTSTMLDKNINTLRYMPNGLTLIGTTQVSGRGRGGNVWVNPPGVLAFSTVLRIPIEPSVASPPIVLIQYLVGISVVEAVLSYGRTLGNSADYSNIPIKIKWPNDVYLMKPEFYGDQVETNNMEPSFVKISGSLVNTNVLDGCFYLVTGVGVNVSNVAPTTSLNVLIQRINELNKLLGKPLLESISEPMFLANYMTIFNELFTVFLREGFNDDLKQLYYKHWLHSGQLVTVDASSNTRTGTLGRKIKAKITGISGEWGLLVADEVDYLNSPTGNKYELQPDGNTFDMFKGLISKKV